MATVIGIFQNQYIKKKPLTVVKPGSQSRRFTHVTDTIKVCIKAWRQNKRVHYSISHKKSFTILEVAKMFSSNIQFLPKREGERFSSKLTKMNLSNLVERHYGKKNLKNYINDFKINAQKININLGK